MTPPTTADPNIEVAEGFEELVNPDSNINPERRHGTNLEGNQINGRPGLDTDEEQARIELLERIDAEPWILQNEEEGAHSAAYNNMTVKKLSDEPGETRVVVELNADGGKQVSMLIDYPISETELTQLHGLLSHISTRTNDPSALYAGTAHFLNNQEVPVNGKHAARGWSEHVRVRGIEIKEELPHPDPDTAGVRIPIQAGGLNYASRWSGVRAYDLHIDGGIQKKSRYENVEFLGEGSAALANFSECEFVGRTILSGLKTVRGGSFNGAIVSLGTSFEGLDLRNADLGDLMIRLSPDQDPITIEEALSIGGREGLRIKALILDMFASTTTNAFTKMGDNLRALLRSDENSTAVESDDVRLPNTVATIDDLKQELSSNPLTACALDTSQDNSVVVKLPLDGEEQGITINKVERQARDAEGRRQNIVEYTVVYEGEHTDPANNPLHAPFAKIKAPDEGENPTTHSALGAYQLVLAAVHEANRQHYYRTHANGAAGGGGGLDPQDPSLDDDPRRTNIRTEMYDAEVTSDPDRIARCLGPAHEIADYAHRLAAQINSNLESGADPLARVEEELDPLTPAEQELRRHGDFIYYHSKYSDQLAVTMIKASGGELCAIVDCETEAGRRRIGVTMHQLSSRLGFELEPDEYTAVQRHELENQKLEMARLATYAMQRHSAGEEDLLEGISAEVQRDPSVTGRHFRCSYGFSRTLLHGLDGERAEVILFQDQPIMLSAWRDGPLTDRKSVYAGLEQPLEPAVEALRDTNEQISSLGDENLLLGDFANVAIAPETLTGFYGERAVPLATELSEIILSGENELNPFDADSMRALLGGYREVNTPHDELRRSAEEIVLRRFNSWRYGVLSLDFPEAGEPLEREARFLANTFPPASLHALSGLNFSADIDLLESAGIELNSDVTRIKILKGLANGARRHPEYDTEIFVSAATSRDAEAAEKLLAALKEGMVPAQLNIWHKENMTDTGTLSISCSSNNLPLLQEVLTRLKAEDPTLFPESRFPGHAASLDDEGSFRFAGIAPEATLTERTERPTGNFMDLQGAYVAEALRRATSSFIQEKLNDDATRGEMRGELFAAYSNPEGGVAVSSEKIEAIISSCRESGLLESITIEPWVDHGEREVTPDSEEYKAMIWHLARQLDQGGNFGESFRAELWSRVQQQLGLLSDEYGIDPANIAIRKAA